MNWLPIVAIKFYQTILWPVMSLLNNQYAHCRFTPTCSHYALEAFQKHRFFKALSMTVGRLARCHPFGSFGYDPVPGKEFQEKGSNG